MGKDTSLGCIHYTHCNAIRKGANSFKLENKQPLLHRFLKFKMAHLKMQEPEKQCIIGTISIRFKGPKGTILISIRSVECKDLHEPVFCLF